jgi:hypothetical protein
LRLGFVSSLIKISGMTHSFMSFETEKAAEVRPRFGPKEEAANRPLPQSHSPGGDNTIASVTKPN